MTKTVEHRPTTTVDGLVYILVSEPNRADYVSRYTGSEMIECFSAEELEKLTREGFLHRYRGGKLSCSFTNMVFAAQVMTGRR